MMRRIVETEEPASRDASEHWGVATLWFVRIALPAGILLGGIALASLFRRSPPVEEASLPRPQEGVPFRQPASRPSGRGDVPPSSRRIESSANRPALKAPRSPSAVVLTPAAPSDPPSLPKSYPYPDPPAARRGVSVGFGLPVTGVRDRSTQTHKIADGDTLPELARTYLGDVHRASEIFQANRDVLTSPEILPIGAELKIPAERAVEKGEGDIK